MFEQRPRIPVYRVARGQWDRSNLWAGACVIGRTGTASVRTLPARMGIDNDKVAARSLVLVGDASRYHNDIASAQLHPQTILTPESQTDPTGDDAEHLMGGTVIVMTGVNSILPGLRTTISVK